MMRRTVWLTAIFVMLFSMTVRAADSPAFSCAYAQKTSGTFYVDISCDTKITAAVFTLRFDSGKVRYMDLETVQSTATSRADSTNDKVTVCLADSSAADGKLCRLRFKALSAGEARFSLSVEQAADCAAQPLNGIRGDILTADLSEKDAASVTDDNNRQPTVKAPASSRSVSGRSTIATRDEEGEEEAAAKPGGVFDLRSRSGIPLIAGAVALALALVALGIMIGKKMSRKDVPKTPGDDAEPTRQEPSVSRPTPEEKQAIIDELNQEIKP